MRWNIRTGALSRFLVYPKPENVHIKSEFFVFNLLLGLFPLLLGGYFFASCGIEEAGRLWRGETPLQQLAAPLSAEELSQGKARVGGVLARDVGEAPPLFCYVEQERRSGKNTETQWSGSYIRNALLRTSDGQLFDLSIDNVRWQPSEAVSSGDREAFWRGVLGLSSGGWINERCIHEGEPFFVEACRGEEGILQACGSEPLTVASGSADAQVLLDDRASRSLGELMTLGIAALFALLYGWRVLGRHPLAKSLAVWAGASDELSPWEKRVSFGALLGLAGLFVGHLLLHWLSSGYYLHWSPGGYLVSFFVIAAGLVMAAHVVARRRILRAAFAPLRAAPVLRLSQFQSADQLASVEVRVAPDAPTHEGPLSREGRAWWWLTGTRIFRSGNNYQSAVYTSFQSKNLVPVEDSSGVGLLDLGQAQLSVRAVRETMTLKRFLARFQDPRMNTSRAMGEKVQLEENYLVPGESLYLFGRVSRLAPSSSEGAAYRGAASVPVLGSAPERPLVAYAGTRRGLLRWLRLEALGLDLLLVGVVALVLSTVGVSLWFASF